MYPLAWILASSNCDMCALLPEHNSEQRVWEWRMRAYIVQARMRRFQDVYRRRNRNARKPSADCQEDPRIVDASFRIEAWQGGLGLPPVEANGRTRDEPPSVLPREPGESPFAAPAAIDTLSTRLKIAVSTVRFCPGPPLISGSCTHWAANWTHPRKHYVSSALQLARAHLTDA